MLAEDVVLNISELSPKFHSHFSINPSGSDELSVNFTIIGLKLVWTPDTKLTIGGWLITGETVTAFVTNAIFPELSVTSNLTL